jgi:hypothetical protein
LKFETATEESYICYDFNNFKNRDERNANVQSQCAFKKISTYAALQSLDNASTNAVRQCPTVRHHRPLKVRQAKGQVETLTPIFESKLQISYFGDSMISCLFNSS